MKTTNNSSHHKQLPSCKHKACRIIVGTSGFSYPEWVLAGVYPKGTKSAEMLSLYCAKFQAVELNYTWYQMVRAESLARMRSRVGPDFKFATKLTRTLTHEIADNWKKQAENFRLNIKPLLDTRQLSAVLIQLPPTFERTRRNRLYLAQLLDSLDGLPLAVEFRHRSWANDRVFAELAQRKTTLVTVDAPKLAHLFPTLDTVTNPDLFYIRFHGRNIEGWRSGNMQQKFNYNYQETELRTWVEKIIPSMASRCRNGLLFFNNHVAGQAILNAETTIRLLANNNH